MKELSEYAELISKREEMYNFLAHLFKIEVDEKVLAYLKHANFPHEGEAEMIEGYRLMKTYVDENTRDTITDLAVDYAKVFLGAGLAEIDQAAYPYESVYTSESKLVMQEARDEILANLREHNLTIKNAYNEPEDHLFVHLEIMAFLCQKILAAVNEGNTVAAQAYLAEQNEFIEKHLLNWVPAFCKDVERHALTNFYKGVAKVTNQFILMDKAIIAEMLPPDAA